MVNELLRCENYQSLEKRHQKFVLNYLKYYNGTKAAREAGFSAKTATEQASRLLTKVKVQKALQRSFSNNFTG